MRGYGNPEVAWAIESNLDELAEAAGIDPLELRLRNCNEPGETTPMGAKIGTCGLRECLEATGKHLSWKEKRGHGKGKARGVGLASLMHVGGSGRIYRSDGSGMILKLDDFGNVNASYGGVEMGQGLHSAIALMLADSLGVRPEKVHVNPVDTGTCPWDVGTHASRGAFMAGNCAIRAAEKARARLFELAEVVYPEEVERNLQKLKKEKPGAQIPDFDVRAASKRDRFELRDSVLWCLDAPDEPWAKIELARFLRAIHFRPNGETITVSAFWDPPSDLPDWEKGMGNMSATYAYGTQGFEVEVDTDTGDVKILRAVCAHDVGKVLNRQTILGQVYGGLVQGIGYALTEEVKCKDGRVQNPGFRDYKIPTAPEIDFPIDVELVEVGDKYGPFGSKGIGEPGLVPTAPAINNAIYDAVGVRIHDLPITPENVLAALQEKRRKESK
jgi:CO/xanthine dehydrogenase Mo-binding subunit